MRYRKKPVEIDAWEYTGTLTDAPNWLIEALNAGTVGTHPELYINTLEGRMHVSNGDYVVRGIKGELYPCKPDIFHRCYEEVL